jgi:amino acid adenylation domain-containing protein
MSDERIQAGYSLSPMQQGMLVHSLHEWPAGVYVQQMVCELRERVNVPLLIEAWQRTVERHEVLRTAFRWDGLAEPIQEVHSAIKLSFEFEDLSSLDPEAQTAKIGRYLETDRQSGFELSVAPLTRLALFRLRAEDHRLIWTFHHALLDGRSHFLILKEVFDSYDANLRGYEIEPKAARPYHEYIDWLAKMDLSKAEAFWRHVLRGFTTPTALQLFHSPVNERGHLARELRLSSEITATLRLVVQRHDVTLNNLVQAAWGLLLSRYSDEEDVVFGVTRACRYWSRDGSSMVGLFINTLPFRVRVRSDQLVKDWLAELRAQHLTLREYEHTPLMKIQQWSEMPPGTALFDSVLVFENYQLNERLNALGGPWAHRTFQLIEQTNYPLTLAVYASSDLLLKLEYDRRRFDSPSIERLLDHLRTLLQNMAVNSDRPMRDIRLLTETERRQILIDWNHTATTDRLVGSAGPQMERGDIWDRSCTIHEVFAERARRNPEAVALVFEDQRLTYRELNQRANQLARSLQRRGVGPDIPVAVCLERSIELVVALLGILKAGGAYVPVDPSYPSERIAFMLRDLQAGILLTQEHIANHLPEHPALTVRLDSDWEEIAQAPTSDPETSVTAANLAYVIYTSGSTGKPKGVAVNHSSVVHLFDVMQPRIDFGGSDVWTVSHSYGFDFSVWEIFGALLSGARLVIVPLRITQSPREFYELLRAEHVTVLSLTPPALRQLIRFEPAPQRLRLRLLIGGGDAFPSDLAPELLGWNIPVWNFYGPTESTVWATIKQVEANDVQYKTVPVGKTIADIEAYLLDEELRPVSAGSVGELHLGGLGLARGYFKRPELTAERFIPNPFSKQPGARLYKTGDLGRYLANGHIEHLGRLDHQVKLRGFRIELEEIEAVLTQHEGVAQCVVVVREDQPGERRLVAYLEPRPGCEPKVRELLGAAKAQLPEYMVPAAFVLMEKLPLTPNRKIDRLTLPAPNPTRPDLKQEFVAARTPTEDMLAEIWSTVLCLDRVGVQDNFFELGGHSLLATKVISRVRDAFQVDLPLSDIFEYPTVAQLAKVLDQAEHMEADLQSLSIGRAPRGGPMPLSFPQERVWFLQQLFPETLAYNFQSRLHFKGLLDLGVLEKSLTEIVKRREIYRVTFPAKGGRPVQVIHDPWPVKVEMIDLEKLPEAERTEAAEQRIQAELRKHFDVTRLPLIRWILLRLAENDHILLHVEHHLVHDGWSFNIFLNELFVLYRAFAAGKPSPLRELPVQFVDFAVWQRQWMRGEVARRQLNYWQGELKNSPQVLEVRTDRPRPPVQSFRGTSRRLELPLSLCESLRKFSREHNVTLFMTLLAAFEVLLYRLTQQEDFCVGSGIANRRWPETEDMIGMLVNTIALRADLSGAPTFLELLGRARRSTLEAYTHQDLPFEQLVDALQRGRDLSRNPLFQIMFNFHDAPLPELDLPGLTVDLVEVISNQSSKFDFNLIIIPRAEQRVGWKSQSEPAGITEIWEYNTDLFDEWTILRFEGLYRNLLESIVANPDQEVAKLSLLAPAERQQLLNMAEPDKTARPKEWCVHQLFEQQVARTPENIALVFGEEQLTYRELNDRANQVARFLRQRGVGPELPVGICLERSIEMVVGLLGILKAGGAYLPLDPSYPPERLSFMIDDAGLPILLTQESLTNKLPAHGAELICLDSDWPEIANESAENLDSDTKRDNLAYVIYTSGSTGKPKGVLVTHHNILRLFETTERSFQFTDKDVWTLFHSYAFDFSVWEIWGALLYGGRLVVVPYWISRSPREFHELLRAERVTVLNQTPSAFRQFVQADLSLNGNQDLALRMIVFGGEALELNSLRPWFERHGDQSPKMVNMYGITETTVHVTYRPLRVADLAKPAGSVIGGPLDDLQLYILDRYLEPVPIGVAGEIYVGGAGLSRGYLNHPELTAERFVPHPFSQAPGARLYKTGDLAHYLANGDIEYLGRADRQVKIRGFRIELGEIEASLRRHADIADCVVISRENESGDVQLIAYYISKACAPPKLEALRDYLKEHIPDYMVPAFFVPVEKFSLTPNGKIDLRALPLPEKSRQDFLEEFVPPRTETEKKLAAIWGEVLGREPIGLFDNFFVLGGHSLLATQIMSRVRDAFHVNLPLRSFFEKPTVADLAEFVVQTGNLGPATRPVIRPLPRE